MKPPSGLAVLLAVAVFATASVLLATPLGHDAGDHCVRALTHPNEAIFRPGPRPDTHDHGSIPQRFGTAPGGPPTAVRAGRVPDPPPSAASHAARAVLRI